MSDRIETVDGAGNERFISFFDEHHNPMDVDERNILVIGKLFAIVRLPNAGGQNIVGLFLEDDDNYFFKAQFSSYWLDDLSNVAKDAKRKF